MANLTAILDILTESEDVLRQAGHPLVAEEDEFDIEMIDEEDDDHGDEYHEEEENHEPEHEDKIEEFKSVADVVKFLGDMHEHLNNPDLWAVLRDLDTNEDDDIVDRLHNLLDDLGSMRDELEKLED